MYDVGELPRHRGIFHSDYGNTKYRHYRTSRPGKPTVFPILPPRENYSFPAPFRTTCAIVAMEIRNIAIIAHVDPGKTTLTDALMRQTGVAEEGGSMDSHALEFERVLRSIDSVLLVVDAQEGPMPQTRFVLKKSLELGLKPIVIINKIDKPAADPVRAEEQVLELFLELGASNEQADFPVMYAIGKQGIAKRKLTDESSDLTPLLDLILEKVPVSSSAEATAKPLRLQPFNLE